MSPIAIPPLSDRPHRPLFIAQCVTRQIVTRQIVMFLLIVMLCGLWIKGAPVLAQTEWDAEFENSRYLVHRTASYNIDGDRTPRNEYHILGFTPDENGEYRLDGFRNESDWHTPVTSLTHACQELLNRPEGIFTFSQPIPFIIYNCALRPYMGEPANFLCTDAVGLPAAECDALKALYLATDGANWQTNDWFGTFGPCNWDDITCDDGHVRRLVRANEGLSGELPALLANLSHLEVLNLGRNDLTGSIPAQLAGLDYLQHLNLLSNKLTGVIPESLLGTQNYTQTLFPQPNVELFLDNNQLTGSLPADLGRTDVKRVVVRNNLLDGAIPNSYPKLPELTNFVYSNTQICEPQDQAMLTWLAEFSDSSRTNLSCENEQTSPLSITIPEDDSIVFTLNNQGLGSGEHPLRQEDQLSAKCSASVFHTQNVNPNLAPLSANGCPVTTDSPPEESKLTCGAATLMVLRWMLGSPENYGFKQDELLNEEEREKGDLLLMSFMLNGFEFDADSEFCKIDNPPLVNTAGILPDLALGIENGAIGVDMVEPNLHLQIQTDVATVDSQGLNSFIVLHNSSITTTLITSVNGNIQITPSDPNTSPFSLGPYQQVAIDESGIKATADPNLIFLPTVQR